MGTQFPELRAPTGESSGALNSSLNYKAGEHSSREKRRSVGEALALIKRILNMLPEDSKRIIGNQVLSLDKDPEEVIKVIEREIEAKKEIVKILLGDYRSTPEQAVLELKKMFSTQKPN